MSVKEFRELGLVQEMNRMFLHPMGLALEVVIEEDGTEKFGEIWDCRDDPEGIRFAPGVISSEKVGRVREMFRSKFDVRKAKFGSNIQKENEDDGA
jgi:hypothetical protein